MKVLVIGSGAREHALIWKIAQNPKVKKIYAAPGNGGIAQLAECVNISDSDIDGQVEFALQKKIDLTIVGPELPLVNGVVDLFVERGLKIFGPHKAAAHLEGSKAFAKDFMEKYSIPTARYRNCYEIGDAVDELSEVHYPVVVKADGLAAGKGVLICNDQREALAAIQDIMKNKKFGDAGESVVIEEFLEGTEASLLCFVDGHKLIPMESARDYKKAFDGDTGLNTGGMGGFSPNPIFNEKITREIQTNILDNISYGLRREKLSYKGILFIGLMINKRGTKVLEFNVRFGDPETEVIIPRLETDIIDIIESTIAGTLTADQLKWTDKKCLCVMLTSGGYPESYEKDKEITGLDKLDKDVLAFHGGTKLEDGKLLTNGGRVMALTALGNSLNEIGDKVYKNIFNVRFDKMTYRSDIGEL